MLYTKEGHVSAHLKFLPNLNLSHTSYKSTMRKYSEFCSAHAFKMVWNLSEVPDEIS